jgi:hypothetical protein
MKKRSRRKTMSFDCCRSSGSSATPLSLSLALGTIPGAVPGNIPEEFAARDPIYFDGLVSLDEFLASSDNYLDMRPDTSSDSFVWPVTSRFSFVSSVFFALLASLLICSPAQAGEQLDQDRSSGRIISFVCGHPQTLQALAPWDCAAESAVKSETARVLPQGASPIAEMKFMPPPKARKKTLAMATKSAEAKAVQVKPAEVKSAEAKTAQAKPAEVKNEEAKTADARSADRIYEKLVKLSLSDPGLYNAEAPSLITYFSILSGGQSQKRVAELEEILERNLHSK